MRLVAVEFEGVVGGVLRIIFLPLVVCKVGSGGEEFIETCKPPFIDLNNRRPRVWDESYLRKQYQGSIIISLQASPPFRNCVVNATLATPYQSIGFWEKTRTRSKAAVRHLISIPHSKSLSKISESNGLQ